MNFEAYEAYAEDLLSKAHAPGAAVAAARGGRPVYERGFGFRDVEAGIRHDSHSVMGIGSITKSFTCIGIMQLQEQGKLNVHDPVVKYLPEIRLSGGQRADGNTIHHLMTHSSGLPPLRTLVNAMKDSLDADPDVHESIFAKLHSESAYAIRTYRELMDDIAAAEFTFFGKLLIEHSGGIKGVAAQMYVVPESRITCIVLSNVMGGPSQALAHGLVNVLEGREPQQRMQPDLPVYSADEGLLEQYAGVYRAFEGTKAEFALHDNKLCLVADEHRVPLTPIGPDRFAYHALGQNFLVVFHRDPSGQVARVSCFYRQLQKQAAN